MPQSWIPHSQVQTKPQPKPLPLSSLTPTPSFPGTGSLSELSELQAGLCCLYTVSKPRSQELPQFQQQALVG